MNSSYAMPLGTERPLGNDTRDKPRICMVAYTNYSNDGRVRLEAESLALWGYCVTFLVPKEANTASRKYTVGGVNIVELNVSKYQGHNRCMYVLSYALFLLLSTLKSLSLFLRSHIKVFHIHNMPNGLVLAALIPRLMGCKLVLDLHDTVPETYQAKFGKASGYLIRALCLEERICCFLASKVICVNHPQREVVIQRGVPGSKIVTVITMPRLIRQEPVLNRCAVPRRVFRMVNHGTISKRLGNDLLIHAAAKLIHQIPELELHIIGDGDNLEELYNLNRSLGLEQYVHFHPPVAFDKLAEQLSGMDVGIVANRANVATHLMLPSKLIDYAVLGIPAIVPRLRTLEYYFTDDMVSYFQAEDVDSLVRAALELYNDRGRRGRQAVNAKSFVEKYAWENQQGGLRELYDGLTSECALAQRELL